MTKLKSSMFALILLGAALAGAEQAARAVLSAETLERLAAEGELRRSLWAHSPAELIPAVTAAGQIRQGLEQLDLSIGTEVLKIYEHRSRSLDTPEARLIMYNILRSISTMEGIEYYSASRKRMRTLFTRSYVIDDPGTQKRLPDPVVQDIPSESSLYLFQEDLTFGDNLYRFDYLYTGQYYLITGRNLTTMRYLLLPMVKPENSITYILLIPVGNQIVFYGATGARTLSLFGLERSREDSFYNRLKAIYGWFSARMEAVFSALN